MNHTTRFWLMGGAFAIAILCGCNDTAPIDVHDNDKEIYDKAYKDGRFDEKMRWMDYHNNVTSMDVINLQIKVLATGLTIKDFNDMASIAMNTSKPFYNDSVKIKTP